MTLKSQEQTARIMSRIQARKTTMGQIYRTPCVIRNGPGNTFLVELNANAADASKSVEALRNRGADIKGPKAEHEPIVTALVTFDTMSEHIIRTGLIQVAT